MWGKDIMDLTTTDRIWLSVITVASFSFGALVFYSARSSARDEYKRNYTTENCSDYSFSSVSLLDINGDGRTDCWEVKTKEMAILDYHKVCDEFNACDSGIYKSIWVPNPRHYVDVNADGEVNRQEVNTIDSVIQKFYQQNECRGKYELIYVSDPTKLPAYSF